MEYRIRNFLPRIRYIYININMHSPLHALCSKHLVCQKLPIILQIMPQKFFFCHVFNSSISMTYEYICAYTFLFCFIIFGLFAPHHFILRYILFWSGLGGGHSMLRFFATCVRRHSILEAQHNLNLSQEKRKYRMNKIVNWGLLN